MISAELCQVEGADCCRPLPHSKVIYVCEDVNAASHVVQKRGLVDPVTAALSSIKLQGTTPHHAAPAVAVGADINSPGTGSKVRTGWLTGPLLALPVGSAWRALGVQKPCSHRSTSDAVIGCMRHRLCSALPNAVLANNLIPSIFCCQQGAANPTDNPATPNPKHQASITHAKMFALDHGSDELNLAGLLNVLDGVVDTPGRLLVLSTNHPEMLDPALIRPGRINR